MTDDKSIYDQIGGFAAVRKLITEFYDRVLEEDELAEIFAGTNMERLIDHQTKFFSMLLGGPASYSDEELRAVHQRFPITDDHFELTKECLVETMEDHDMEDDHIAIVTQAFESKRKLVVQN